jgi:DNA-binding response OmpR family regulator
MTTPRSASALQTYLEGEGYQVAVAGMERCAERSRVSRGPRRLFSEAGVETPLTTGEFALLKIFLDHPNRLLGRGHLLDLTRGSQADHLTAALMYRLEGYGEKSSPIPASRP